MTSPSQEVMQTVRGFADAWNQHDMEAFASLFEPDAEFVNVVGLWWKGRDEIREAHALTHASLFKESRLSLFETSIRFPAPGLAVARSRWRLEGHRGPGGELLPPRMGLLLNLLRNSGAGWLILDSQNTDIVEGVLSRPQ